MIRLDQLNLSYGELPVIRELSLSVAPGEKIGLIGPSGAGKSTLLRHLAKQFPEAAWMPQDLALVPPLSSFANVHAARLDRHSLWRNLRNLVWPHPQDLAEISYLLKDLRLEDKIRSRVGELSGGQQQRVALARALHRAAPLILADEPVSALDPALAEICLQRLFASSATLLVSLHSVELARRHASRLIALRHGQLFFDLPASQVGDAALIELYRPE
ncbi:MAG: Glutamine transport ATP-binding protein GlnQ [Verrucomicrobiota bacterium]|jgi:phosphonate transport system ATP-binding protein